METVILKYLKQYLKSGLNWRESIVQIGGFSIIEKYEFDSLGNALLTAAHSHRIITIEKNKLNILK